MGRFADINIKNNTDNINVVQSNSGGYNIQNTQVINKTINNNHKKSTDSDGNPIVVGSAVAVIFIVSLLAWLFFSYYEQVYSVLTWGAVTSPVLAFIGLLILFTNKEAERVDVIRWLLMGVLAVIIFSLNGKVNGLIPQDILNVAREVDSASKFWAKLNGHGKNLSLSIISSAILISISIILIHISSFIELAYALANKNQTGFFFFIFKCGQKCRFKTFGVGGMVVLFIVIITLVLEGYIFNINW